MKFRTHPNTIVDAEQWIGQPGVHWRHDGDLLRPYVTTEGGDVDVAPGDWIITDPTGAKLVCAADLFPLVFEPVTDPGPSD